jgi:hypothetical protein
MDPREAILADMDREIEAASEAAVRRAVARLAELDELPEQPIEPLGASTPTLED